MKTTSTESAQPSSAARMRHSVSTLCMVTGFTTIGAFWFGVKGYIGHGATRSASSVLDHLDILIAAGLVLALVGALLGMIAVLLRKYDRLHNRMELLSGTGRAAGVATALDWERRLKVEMAQSRRLGYPLTIGILELERFEHLVAEHGAAHGQVITQGFSSAALKALRGSDMIAPLGEHRFALLLPGCPVEQASRLLHRLADSVPDEGLFSAGVASWHWRETEAALVDRAVGALDRARTEHPGQVVVSPSPPPNVDRPAHRRKADARHQPDYQGA